MPKYIIEHLDSELYKWSLIEYKHISKIVGKGNVIFTNIKNKKYYDTLKNFGAVKKESISDLKFKNICVLDMNRRITLNFKDKNEFQYLLFGGILGDNPPQQRTQTLIKHLKLKNKKFRTRNLGKKQMPTDTAVYVTKKILEGKPLNKIKFLDKIEIKIGKNCSIILPYRYVKEKNSIVISNELIEYLKNKKGL